MGKIVAIGGGEMSLRETETIDRYAISLCSKEKPNLLFIPTASRDSKGYIKAAKEYFESLGCAFSTLCIRTKNPPDDLVEKRILNADIIYVGGGDTVRMMEKWKERKLDTYLKKAYEKGVVLSGLSAGSICWFVFGHSDSNSFLIDNSNWEYVKAYGLGIIPAAHCPHYNEEGRDGFDTMMENETIPGIALENGVALVEVDGRYTIIKSSPERKAYILRYSNGRMVKEELPEGEPFQLNE